MQCFIAFIGGSAEEFMLYSDHILLTDFCKTQYKIDFNGKLLWSSHVQT